MHAFNLSHPSLSLFLQRSDLIDSFFKSSKKNKTKTKTSFWKGLWKVVRYLLIGIGILILFPLFIVASPVLLLLIVALIIILKKNLKAVIQFILSTSVVKKFINQAMRTLTFFEIPLEYQFLVLDYYLQSKMDYQNNQIRMGSADNSAVYDKIVLCPLVIDFGRKNIPDGIFYQFTPKTPVANQVGDLLYAIRTYYRFHVTVEGNKMSLSAEIENWENRKDEKLLEIYPFMGLDTQHYDDWSEIKKLLDKYFAEFDKNDTAKLRQERLFKKMGESDSNMYKKDENYHNVFAGIKVYPQLGFDPFPTNSKEYEKVKELYLYCIEKRIPITSHCSDGGYKVGDNDHLTSPLGKWKNILEQKEFQELTLNFAHFGSQQGNETEWIDAIIKLTQEYPNIYTDISCNDMSAQYYHDLGTLFNDQNPQLHKKVLFGSDFSINMLVTEAESYNQYLEAFAKAELPHKTDLCQVNSERFLFGEK